MLVKTLQGADIESLAVYLWVLWKQHNVVILPLKYHNIIKLIIADGAPPAVQ